MSVGVKIEDNVDFNRMDFLNKLEKRVSSGRKSSHKKDNKVDTRYEEIEDRVARAHHLYLAKPEAYVNSIKKILNDVAVDKNNETPPVLKDKKGNPIKLSFDINYLEEDILGVDGEMNDVRDGHSKKAHFNKPLGKLMAKYTKNLSENDRADIFSVLEKLFPKAMKVADKEIEKNAQEKAARKPEREQKKSKKPSEDGGLESKHRRKRHRRSEPVTPVQDISSLQITPRESYSSDEDGNKKIVAISSASSVPTPVSSPDFRVYEDKMLIKEAKRKGSLTYKLKRKLGFGNFSPTTQEQIDIANGKVVVPESVEREADYLDWTDVILHGVPLDAVEVSVREERSIKTPEIDKNSVIWLDQNDHRKGAIRTDVRVPCFDTSGTDLKGDFEAANQSESLIQSEQGSARSSELSPVPTLVCETDAGFTEHSYFKDRVVEDQASSELIQVVGGAGMSWVDEVLSSKTASLVSSICIVGSEFDSSVSGETEVFIGIGAKQTSSQWASSVRGGSEYSSRSSSGSSYDAVTDDEASIDSDVEYLSGTASTIEFLQPLVEEPEKVEAPRIGAARAKILEVYKNQEAQGVLDALTQRCPELSRSGASSPGTDDPASQSRTPSPETDGGPATSRSWKERFKNSFSSGMFLT